MFGRFRRSRRYWIRALYSRLMRTLLVALLVLSACAPAPPAPAVHHEVILDVTNNRDDAVIIRVVPRILQITGPPAQADTGQGDGSEVAAGERRTLRLPMTTIDWTITVNGSALIPSTDHDFIPGGWTAGRLVVNSEDATMELDRSEPAPSN
jgi:hypothetical protein